MRFSPRIVSSAVAVAAACVVSAAAYYYKTRTVEINEVMVFCKLQFNVYDSFNKLMSYVEGATKSIDVCMPSIHNPAIQARLVKVAMEKKIPLRILIDRNGYNESTEFLLRELVDAGAEIKCRVNEPFNKQHKFCVIDGKILLTGTLNWGDDRSSDTWNYVYITNTSDLVRPVRKEFDQMWSTGLVPAEAVKLSPAGSETDDSESPEMVGSNESSDIEEVKNEPQEGNECQGKNESQEVEFKSQILRLRLYHPCSMKLSRPPNYA